MKRIMFDTSVYGKLIIDEDLLKKINIKINKHEFIVYSAFIIRKELRATPKTASYGNKKLRILLLNLHDNVISKDNQLLKFNKLIEDLSNDYFLDYKKIKGPFSKDEIMDDFIIVATATIHQLDVIVSDDERTMLSEKAVISYKSINKKYGLKDPNLKKYTNFKKELARRFSSV